MDNARKWCRIQQWDTVASHLYSLKCYIVWQPRRAADTAKNWRQSLFCCCTASMEQATDGAETTAIAGLVSSSSENISVSFCLYGHQDMDWLLWCALGLLVGGAIQVPQLQLLTTRVSVVCSINYQSQTALVLCGHSNLFRSCTGVIFAGSTTRPLCYMSRCWRSWRCSICGRKRLLDAVQMFELKFILIQHNAHCT